MEWYSLNLGSSLVQVQVQFEFKFSSIPTTSWFSTYPLLQGFAESLLQEHSEMVMIGLYSCGQAIVLATTFWNHFHTWKSFQTFPSGAKLAVWNQWNGMVEWNSGMEYWNDLLS